MRGIENCVNMLG
jgi:hypothetical protein